MSGETKNETFLGINCVATGWGQTQMKGRLQDKLRQVQLTVINNRHCHEMYTMKYNIDVENDTHLCAGPIIAGGKGTCIVRKTTNFKKNITLQFEDCRLIKIQ